MKGFCSQTWFDVYRNFIPVTVNSLDLNHVVALTYEAKKRSEKAQGVGEATDIHIVCQEHVTTLPQDKIAKLDEIYRKRSDEEKRAVREKNR